MAMFSKKVSEEKDALEWENTVQNESAAATVASAEIVYQPAAGCVISAGTVLTGNIEANDNVVLEGRMVGDISATGRVRIVGNLEGNAKAASIILDKGTVKGDITADETVTIENGSTLTGNTNSAAAHINGTVIGNLIVSGQITLCSQANITGDVKCASMIMEAGAVVKGQFQVG